MKAALLGLGLLLSGAALGFLAGRGSAPAAHPPLALLVQQQAPDDPRELVPLTPQGGQDSGQGQRPQTGQGGQGKSPGNCTLLQFKDGQFYRLQPQPGQGGQPGQGQGSQGGQGAGGDNELYPVTPVNPGDVPGGLPGLPSNSDPVRS